MINFELSQETIDDVVVLADCIELTVALNNDYDGHFTRANFMHAVQSEIFSEEEDAAALNKSFGDAMNLIENRASWLGETYPFKREKDEVQFAPKTSKKHYLSYLFLLACSCHNQIPSLRHNLRIEFENLCKEAMRALFPACAEVFLFSQNSKDRENLGRPATEAIPALAKKLNTQVLQSAKLPNTQREYGIDLIAIYPFGDEVEYPFFAFAQCTVAKEWWTKQREAKADQDLKGVMSLTNHTNFLLIPHFPRTNLTEWRADQLISIDCILCDRYRICRLLEKSKPLICKVQSCGMYGMRKIFQKIQEHLPKHYQPN